MKRNVSMKSAVERSIAHGIEAGKIDPERDAAIVEMLRYMAGLLDSDNQSSPALKLVTPSSFLSYCDKLGLAPELATKVEDLKLDKAESEKVIPLTGNSKWKKAQCD